ncbi:hypothetical protein ACWJPO_25655, partial [Klebsiella pneumoniae]
MENNGPVRVLKNDWLQSSPDSSYSGKYTVGRFHLDLPLYFQTPVITLPITGPLPQIFPWRAITQRTMRMP